MNFRKKQKYKFVIIFQLLFQFTMDIILFTNSNLYIGMDFVNIRNTTN